MSAGEIRVELELDDGKFTVRSKRAGKTIREMGRDFDRTSKSVKNIENSVTGFLPKLRDLAITASILKGGLVNLYQATIGWQKSIIDTNAQIERMTFLLRGMSTATTVEGQIREAADDVAYLLDQAERAPFSLGEMTNTLVKMRSVGLEGARDAMEALTDSVAQFGGTDETLHRATIAIQQMAGKGVISMEELRQQLGEAVPTAINLMARSMNMTYQGLVDAISSGRVEANDALQRMFREMERTMGGAGERMMDTWSGMVSRLQTRWMKLQLAVGEQGMYLQAKEGLQMLIDTLDEGQIQMWGQAWGQMLAQVIEGVTILTRFLIDHGGQILEITKNLAIMWAAWKGVGIATAGLVALRAAMDAYKMAMVRASVAAATAKAAQEGVAMSMLSTGAAAGRATVLMRAFWVAATGPVGMIVAGIVAIGSAFIDFGSDVDRATQMIENNTRALDENSQKILENAINQKKNRVFELQEQIAEYDRQLANYRGPVREDGRKSNYESKRLTDRYQATQELMQLEGELNQYLGALNAGRLKQQEYHGRAMVEQVRRQIAQQTSEVNSGYSNEMRDLAKLYEGKLVNEAEFGKRRSEIIKESYDSIEAVLNEQAAKIDEQFKKAATPLERAGLEAQAKYVKEEIQKVQDLRTQEIINATRSANLLEKATVGNNSRLANVLANAKAKVAELTAELEGGEGIAARFKAQLEGGVFGDEGRALMQDKARLQEFIEVLEEQGRIEEALASQKRIRRESEQAQTQIQERLTKATQEAATAMKYLLTGEDTSFIDQLNADFEVLLDKIPKGTAEYEKFLQMAEQAKQASLNAEGAKLSDEFVQNTQRINNSLLTDRGRYWREYIEKDRKAQQDLKALEGMSAQERMAAEKALADYRVALWDEYQRNSETPMQTMLRNWGDVTTQMQNATANWLDDATDRLVEFAKTGKFEFSDMIESMLSDILKMQLQAQTSNIFGGAAGGGGNTGAIGSAIASGAGKAWNWITSFFADGGIMTGNGSVPLRKYATGGIANTPQLAMFGEGSMPEAYVPLPDGRTIPVTVSGEGLGGQAPSVQVNVINQTSQEVNANQGQMKFDGRKMILDVVMTAAATPGPFRDSLKGAVR